MTEKEKRLRESIAAFQKEFNEAQKTANFWKRQLEDAKRELGRYLETTEEGRPMFFI